MSSRKLKRRNTSHTGASSRLAEIVRRATVDLQVRSRPAAAYRFKTENKPDDLFATFPRVFPERDALEQVHGAAFPKVIRDLYAVPSLYAPSGPLIEVVWGICRCLQYGNEIAQFLRIKESYERALLLNDREYCCSLLTQIEQRFGVSVWLVQNRLATTQLWQSLEDVRTLRAQYLGTADLSSLAKAIVLFVAKRTEATLYRGRLEEELDQTLGESVHESLASFIRVKLFELHSIATSDVPNVLFWEAQAGIIDYYETLISVLQSAAIQSAIPKNTACYLEKPLTVLFSHTGDVRLHGICRGLGIYLPPPSQPHERVSVIEAYSGGDYKTVVRVARAYLESHPEDIPIRVLCVKAQQELGEDLSPKDGILNEIDSRLRLLISFSNETYSSAYQLLTLCDRYYGHLWAQSLRAAVRYELRTEQIQYPDKKLREVFVLDPYVSPFSILATEKTLALRLQIESGLRQKFPSTHKVFVLATTGKASAGNAVDERRRHKYLAIYNLSHGKFHAALEHLHKLLEAEQAGESLRYAGAAALACLGTGDIDGATRMAVSAYLDNQNAPTVLPIREIVEAMDKPESWPDTIYVPLVFALYSTYVNPDRLAHMRYAFERFQERQEITTPESFVGHCAHFGLKATIFYMDRVWRPEIMRQTILYSGSREIEEERIRVCKKLAELDPENAQRYLDEIKERVKQLEIAKAASLIEQSKVYVDIEAIKKSLKQKLGDSYARYKRSSQETESENRDLMYQLGEVVVAAKGDLAGASVPAALSKIHFLDQKVGSEADVQFASLFFEITNEFLRGSHGLNAFLSTRVRHGTLSNILRKAVAEEHIVTSLEEGKNTYTKNEHWGAVLARSDAASENGEVTEQILAALEVFAARFDGIIAYVRDQLIQIRVVHNVADMAEQGDAQFVYHSSNLERSWVQEQDRAMASMEDLVGYCIDILWQKTDENLLRLQEKLNVEIRGEIAKAFDSLMYALNDFAVYPGVGDLLNAVLRARTQTQAKLTMVVSWFKRSEVYDRQDYAVDLPISIALNMVRNTIFNATDWQGVSVDVVEKDALMPGRTLDGMVYVFFGLLENAILRSGLAINDLMVVCKVSYVGGVFSARVSNPIHSTKSSEGELEKLTKLREALKGQEYSHRAQSEGRSGLAKIWMTINSPLYHDPDLQFYQAEGLFVVDVRFRLDTGCNENIVN